MGRKHVDGYHENHGTKREYYDDNLVTQRLTTDDVVLGMEIELSYRCNEFPGIREGGSREVECEYCDGTGHQDCGYCDGTGCVTCPECDGTSMVECPHCAGTMQVVKLDDNGDIVLDDDGDIVCTRCQHCNSDGEVTCPSCDGDGALECEDCDGHGYVDCNECGGEGRWQDEDYEQDFIYDVPSPYDNMCVFEHDGSVDEGFEVITEPCTVDAMTSFLTSDWFKELVESSDGDGCGVHIHISRQSDDMVKKWVMFMLRYENELTGLTRVNSFAKPYRRTSDWLRDSDENTYLTQIYKAMDKAYSHNQSYDEWTVPNADLVDEEAKYLFKTITQTRHLVLNLTNQHTMELRFFNHTNDVERLVGYAKLVMDINDILKGLTLEQVMTGNFSLTANHERQSKWTEVKVEYEDSRKVLESKTTDCTGLVPVHTATFSEASVARSYVYRHQSLHALVDAYVNFRRALDHASNEYKLFIKLDMDSIRTLKSGRNTALIDPFSAFSNQQYDDIWYEVRRVLIETDNSVGGFRGFILKSKDTDQYYGTAIDVGWVREVAYAKQGNEPKYVTMRISASGVEYVPVQEVAF